MVGGEISSVVEDLPDGEGSVKGYLRHQAYDRILELCTDEGNAFFCDTNVLSRGVRGGRDILDLLKVGDVSGKDFERATFNFNFFYLLFKGGLIKAPEGVIGEANRIRSVLDHELRVYHALRSEGDDSAERARIAFDRLVDEAGGNRYEFDEIKRVKEVSGMIFDWANNYRLCRKKVERTSKKEERSIRVDSSLFGCALYEFLHNDKDVYVLSSDSDSLRLVNFLGAALAGVKFNNSRLEELLGRKKFVVAGFKGDKNSRLGNVLVGKRMESESLSYNLDGYECINLFLDGHEVTSRLRPWVDKVLRNGNGKR